MVADPTHVLDDALLAIRDREPVDVAARRRARSRGTTAVGSPDEQEAVMAYDEKLADRVRDVFETEDGVTERKMFGGLAFMVNGHMACGIVGDELMLRLGADGAERALERPHVRPMDFTGKPMTGMVFVGAEGLRGAALQRWIGKAVGFVGTLPPKG